MFGKGQDSLFLQNVKTKLLLKDNPNEKQHMNAFSPIDVNDSRLSKIARLI